MALVQDHRDILTKILDEELMKKNTKEWLKDFGGVVPAAPNIIIYIIRKPIFKSEERLRVYKFVALYLISKSDIGSSKRR